MSLENGNVPENRAYFTEDSSRKINNQIKTNANLLVNPSSIF